MNTEKSKKTSIPRYPPLREEEILSSVTALCVDYDTMNQTPLSTELIRASVSERLGCCKSRA